MRRLISRGKCTGQEWLDVMRAAHQLNITTSATMMFGHIETLEERFEHLVLLREVQSEKPANVDGFSIYTMARYGRWYSFETLKGIQNNVSADEYLRGMIAISRIMLPNIKNIQASWLTVGKETAQLCLQWCQRFWIYHDRGKCGFNSRSTTPLHLQKYTGIYPKSRI